MALILNGSGHMSRTSGLITSMGTATILLAVKLAGTQTGTRNIWASRPTDDSTDAQVTLYDPGFGGDADPIFQADYGSYNVELNQVYSNSTWYWTATTFNSGTATHYHWNGSAWVSGTCAQSAFTPGKLYIGDAGAATNRLNCKVAAIREFNAVLSESQLTQEIQSLTAVNTANLVSAKRGVGANLTAALLGETGNTFVANGTVTVDSDEPVFTEEAEIIVSQAMGNFSQSLTASTISSLLVTQTVGDFSQALAIEVGAASITVAQSIDDFSKTVTLGLGAVLSAAQTMQDFSQVFSTRSSISAPPVPQYNTISCGPGEYGTPVQSGVRNLKREYFRRWPTK